MKTNVGGIDRMLRIVTDLVLVALRLTGTIGPRGLIGAVPLLTGALGSCSIYALLGFSNLPHEGSVEPQ